MRQTAFLLLVPLLLAAADRSATADLPEGCRERVAPFCADPSWPTAAAPLPPVRRLSAKVPPAPGPEERAVP